MATLLLSLLFAGCAAMSGNQAIDAKTEHHSVIKWVLAHPANSPSSRMYAAMAYDPMNKGVVLFGGLGYPAKALNDTWIWNGATWTLQHPPVSPPAQIPYGGMVFDPKTQEIVLVTRSKYASDVPGETWTWNGVTWTRQYPTTSPFLLAESQIIYDSASGEVLLFTAPLNGHYELWAWNGADWTEQAPLPYWSKRPIGAPIYAYDQATNDVIALVPVIPFTLGQHAFYETWTWNGSTWTRQHPTASPTVVAWPAMAYDNALGQLVLFDGGRVSRPNPDGPFAINETWTWNGVTWTRQYPAVSPRAADATGMTYDAQDGTVVLFGGQGGENYNLLQSTWIGTVEGR